MLLKKLITFLFKVALIGIIALVVVRFTNSKLLEENEKVYKNENNKEIEGTQVHGKEKSSTNSLEVTKEDGNSCSQNVFAYQPLPQNIIDKMKGMSWKPEAPVTLDELSYVKVSYWGFDNKEHQGELIVHKKLAEEVTAIFKELYVAKFPIEKIKLIDEYNASDDLSMADNNTSAFCFREVEGSNGKLSKHSFGIAIDINPVQNPYIQRNKISPIGGNKYLDRSDVRKGMIVKDDVCYKVFKSRGWTWGGEWKTIKDYQHFQKNVILK